MLPDTHREINVHITKEHKKNEQNDQQINRNNQNNQYNQNNRNSTPKTPENIFYIGGVEQKEWETGTFILLHPFYKDFSRKIDIKTSGDCGAGRIDTFYPASRENGYQDKLFVIVGIFKIDK